MSKKAKQQKEILDDDDSGDVKVENVLGKLFKKHRIEIGDVEDDHSDDYDDVDDKKEPDKKEPDKKEQDKKEPDKKEPGKNEEPDKKEDNEDFIPENFDESTVRSPKTAEVIKKFKVSAKKRDEEIKNLQKELSDLKSKTLDSDPAYKSLKEERDKMKELIDTELFYKSDTFIETYSKPLTSCEAKIEKMIGSIEERARPSVIQKFGEAQAAMSKGDEIEFLKIVDEICEDNFTPSVGAKFAKEMSGYYDSFTTYTEAVKDKSKAKKELEEKRSLSANSSIGEASSSIDKFIGNFSKLNEQVINLFESDETLKFEYRKEMESDAAELKTHLTEFAKTGRASQKLQEFLGRASIYRVREKEIETQDKVIKAFSAKIQSLQDEIAKLNKDLGVINSKGKEKKYIDDDDKSEVDNKSGIKGLMKSLVIKHAR